MNLLWNVKFLNIEFLSSFYEEYLGWIQQLQIMHNWQLLSVILSGLTFCQ